jgi:hypothetical protein
MAPNRESVGTSHHKSALKKQTAAKKPSLKAQATPLSATAQSRGARKQQANGARLNGGKAKAHKRPESPAHNHAASVLRRFRFNVLNQPQSVNP